MLDPKRKSAAEDDVDRMKSIKSMTKNVLCWRKEDRPNYPVTGEGPA
jgi:hypothetical protein